MWENHEDLFRIQVTEPNVSVKDVIKKIVRSGNVEDAFYVCDVSDIVKKYKDWKRAMPRIETYYAVKCNAHRLVLETLVAMGSGFDCASKEEIKKILSLGVPPNKIIYAHPTKKLSHLKYAAEVGIEMMTFDNEMELHKVKHMFPTAKLVLRIKYDDPRSNFPLGGKFGANPDTAAKDLLEKAKSLGLEVIGVSFHIGSGNTHLDVYQKAIIASRKVFDMGAELGYQFKLLDIGGGFSGNTGSSINEVGIAVNKFIDQYFPDPSIKIIAEPGQYFVISAFTLVTQIHSKRCLPSQNGSELIRMYYVDISVFNSIIIGLYDLYVKIAPVEEAKGAPVYPSTVWGATCDGSDRVSPETVLLPELAIGDWVAFEEIGAYSLSIASDFNGFELPHVHGIVNRRDWKFLTEAAKRPMSKQKFATGDYPENYLTGLMKPSKFDTNYF
ncbi:unnamed protein product [Acanthoscelides obtectus]|uniref:ornithine decarboxylase n=2 Tax=Acanthoscelides obtectus TaxID=200917 RepID=A0A9P0KL10_ACAOB|nr:unnamed protein product [Acanthoscelides obtectus]CAK1671624.1 Ornithine decarboxylase [Acanthoscelides obtectus]